MRIYKVTMSKRVALDARIFWDWMMSGICTIEDLEICAKMRNSKVYYVIFCDLGSCRFADLACRQVVKFSTEFLIAEFAVPTY